METMKNRNNTPQVLSAFSAGLVLFATTASAATRTLATPPPSEHIDTESSSVVSLAEWPSLGRHLRLKLTANVTLTNSVQVAFGTDRNGDEDLAPEETALVLGVDCGEAFVREEGLRSRSAAEVESCAVGQTTNSTCVFSFKLPEGDEQCFTHAKVTTRGLPEANATIMAMVFNTGLMLIVR